MITHELDVAQHARRIVAMRDGRILSDEANRQVVLADRQPAAGSA
jgi:ABC-type lipoprotein export system ATPase subunit